MQPESTASPNPRFLALAGVEAIYSEDGDVISSTVVITALPKTQSASSFSISHTLFHSFASIDSPIQDVYQCEHLAGLLEA